MLRSYQTEALNAMLADTEVPGNSIVSLPTGAGKSHLIAEYANQLNQDILILAPSKELIEQDISKLQLAGVDKKDIGVYTASLNSKTIKKFTFGIVNSVHKHPEEFAHFKNVLIDECHKVDTNKANTMYRGLIRRMGNPKVTGLTATPWRNVTTNSWQNGQTTITTVLEVLCRSKGGFWDRIIYNKNNRELTPEYLCPLTYETKALVDINRIPLLTNGSDYHQERYARMILPLRYKVTEAVMDAKSRFKSILVFCPSIENATELHQIFEGSGLVTGMTPAKERKATLDGFRSGAIQVVFNVEVLTTGFDHPQLDCIILNRPVKSIGLYYQMLGRGVRQAPGKTTCTVIDLTGSVNKMGGIGQIEMRKYDENWELTTLGHSRHGEVVGKYVVRK